MTSAFCSMFSTNNAEIILPIYYNKNGRYK